MSIPKPSDYKDLRSTITGESHGMRLDLALASCFSLSRRRLRKAIDEGGVYLNRKRCRTAGRILKTGDTLRLVLLENERLTPFDPSQLIWQQPPLYLINKRCGQYSQEALHRSRGTLPDELARHLKLLPQQAESLRPVHRLDRGTSGLMLFSSDARVLNHIQAHWKQAAFKRYLAVTEPAPEWDKKMITLAIDKTRDSKGCYHVSDSGRPCESEARVIERRGNRALLEMIPHTGRTHQLRVHLSSLGCPILGDTRYGGKTHTRLMLHAQYLRLDTPALTTGKEWEAQPEENWQW
ncbi:23S rRNA pseudouridine1911/1915/1917 synthase [Mariprofundus aestuarium]|uniref:23S rRNA pseudouridine1911/1915/1917 synthase n=1 Tax=Mariprofundus aestuarium TaxID=1921086 RepID=A0A2K8KY22_MARES|nr:RluA family pseudouridine synthase [Mariprofundus aestuarium]ATX79890.1 23S rRNA pseudouridine1911/1915/1917 synthase [Mariprofundus aestuarium]